MAELGNTPPDGKVKHRAGWRWAGAVMGILVAASAVTFIASLFMPLLYLEPSLGDPFIEELVETLFGGSFDSKATYLVGGISSLYEEGDWVIATALVFFSIVFPLTKLVALFISWAGGLGQSSRVLEFFLKVIGPWSMGDIFVVAMTVMLFKAFPGGTQITAGPGYYCFGASVMLCFLATVISTFIPQRSQGSPSAP